MIKILATTDTDNVIGIKNQPGMIYSSVVNNKFLQGHMEHETLVLGHNTYKSFSTNGKNVDILVLSAKEKPGRHGNAYFYKNLRTLVEDHDSFVVIGGSQMFHLFMQIADQVILTWIGVSTTATDCLYFPRWALERDFYCKLEMPPVNDIEILSQLNTEIIFTQWERKTASLH